MTHILRTLFASVLTVSLGTSAVILLLTALRRPLGRMRAGGRYLLWLLVMLRLVLPFTLPLAQWGLSIGLPVIPEENVSRGHKLAAKMIAVTVLLGVIALALWGVYLITEVGTMLGVIPIAVAAIISIAQIVAGIVLYRKHH